MCSEGIDVGCFDWCCRFVVVFGGGVFKGIVLELIRYEYDVVWLGIVIF